MGGRVVSAVLGFMCICGSAFGVVVITVVDEGEGWAAINYVSDSNISGLGLDITVSEGVIDDVNILHVGTNDDVNGLGFGIFPSAFARVIDPNDPNWGENGYTPVADAGAPGALGGLGTSGITIECGALGDAAPKSGTLIKVHVTELDCVTVMPNSARGNIVLEGGADGGFTSSSGCVIFPPVWWYPPCWDEPTQCNGDGNGSGMVDTVDWPAFRDGFGKSFPDCQYVDNACADSNRDGSIDTVDWPKFRDHFGIAPPANCTPGDLNGIFDGVTEPMCGW
jgi:hypothetical protein